MNRIFFRLNVIWTISAFLVFALFGIGAASQTQVRVGIVPFQINAPQDLTYLKNGILDMLTSRLTWDEKVTAIPVSPKGPVNEQNAGEIGVQSGVDVIVFGSLSVIGNSISIDAKVLDITGKKSIRTFFIQSPSMDDVIPKIDQLAADINHTVFGRTVAPEKPAQGVEPKRPADDIRAHPDKLAQGGFEDTPSASPDSAFSSSRQTEGPAFWKSQNFSYLINGIAVGDVDKDGRMETLAATPHTVFIYRVENNRMAEIQKIDMGRFVYIIGVDIADINGNGYPEIFATALNSQKNAVLSFVLEYDGTKYRTISEKLPWFFRVVRLSAAESILIGQRGLVEDPFS
ncbi:MAG: VCBS repeat-containing protein, partial [Thermodesulfobacteriota bacterium]